MANYKMKSNSGAKKRFKLTASGRVKRKRANLRHNLTGKSAEQKRRLRKGGYNVLALAQHMDDLAESFLMSAFHGGQLRTMKAHYINDAGDVRIIRPLVYARERQLAAFAVAHCPWSLPDKRTPLPSSS